jgi:ABC-type uncharacterized transport system permease subunit
MNRYLRPLAGPLGAILLIVVLMSLAMIVAGTSPVDGFTALFVGALGGRNELGETLVATTALLFPALGICLAFRAGLFNIGAEGQLLIGALCAGALGAVLTVPGPLGILFMLVAGALGGGAWGAIAGWMKARFGANEIIATLMLNFVASAFALELVSGPLKGPLAAGAETAWLDPKYWLPRSYPARGFRLRCSLRWRWRYSYNGYSHAPSSATISARAAKRPKQHGEAASTWVD